MDLFSPGSGDQVHDFTPGIAPSGLFWTISVPDGAFSANAQTASLHLADVPIVDSFQFLGPDQIPARVSLDITWTAAGSMRHLQPGSSDPTDPTNLRGQFLTASATGTFSGSNSQGFSFSGSAAEGPFSEIGTESNGSFVR